MSTPRARYTAPDAPFTSRRRGGLFLASLALAACAKDEILPAPYNTSFVPAGDGGVADGEAGACAAEAGASRCNDPTADPTTVCNVDSPGCIGCVIQPGWTCTDTDCTPICGDKMIAPCSQETCDPPDGITCDSSCRKAVKTEACDMNGYWIVRQMNFSKDQVVGVTQTSSNWYAYKLSQTGSSFVVTESIFCGIEVSGTVNVHVADASLKYLLHRNPQHETSPDSGGRQRTGTFQASANGCDFFQSAHWYVRGVDPSYLPPLPWSDDPATQPDPTTDTFAALPKLPDKTDTSQVIDAEMSGHKGVGWMISGLLVGERWSVQRDWEWRHSNADYPVAQNAIEFTVADVFSNQENILEAVCNSSDCTLFYAGSYADNTAKHRATFRWLGSSLDDPRVSEIITNDIGADTDKDLATCANVRAALPHQRVMR